MGAKIIRRDKRNKKGFTLSEVMITAAIIGLLATIAVPGYMRIRRNVDMESVKQHMRIIAEKLGEMLGKNGKIPTESEWGDIEETIEVTGGLSENDWKATGLTDDDLIALTPNMQAIHARDYTIDEFVTKDQTQYTFASRGKRAGDKCYYNKNFGPVDEIDCHWRTGIAADDVYSYNNYAEMMSDYLYAGAQTLDPSLTGISIQPFSNIDDWTNEFLYMMKKRSEVLALSRYLSSLDGESAENDGIYSNYFILRNNPVLDKTFEKLKAYSIQKLESQGYEIFFEKVDISDIKSGGSRDSYNNPDWVSDNLAIEFAVNNEEWYLDGTNGTHTAYQISVRPKTPAKSQEEYNQRLSNMQSTTGEDWWENSHG